MHVNWNEYLIYDPTSRTGLRWKVDVLSGKHMATVKYKVGDVAGGKTSTGYFTVMVKGHRTVAHRVIWEMLNGCIAGDTFIDHIDGNKGNNSIDNLRLVTQSENCRNRVKQSNNSSGVTGVNFTEARGSSYWRALWSDLNRKQRFKYFSINKLGYDVALKLACEFRAKAVEGGGYTERHGT